MHIRLVIVAVAASILAAACAASAIAGEPAGKPQTICPVMGRPIDKQFYADHDGKRVYFCCNTCVDIFRKDPEKYIDKLNAEGVVLADAPAEQQGEREEGIAGFIQPLGITTFSFLGLTAVAGALMRRKPRVLRKVHIYLAVVTIVLALIHVSFVLLAE